MAEIKVNVNDKPYVINLNDDKTIDTHDQDFSALAQYLGVTPDALDTLFKKSEFVDGAAYELPNLVELAVDKVASNETEVIEQIEKGETIKDMIEQIDKSIEGLKAELESASTDEQKKTLTEKIQKQAQMKSELNNEFVEAKQSVTKALDKGMEVNDDARTSAEKVFNYKKADANKADNNSNKAGTLGSGASTGNANAANSKAATLGAGGGAKAASGDFSDASLSPMAMLKATTADDNLLTTVDMAGEAKKRQQMMLLFFHYARMAMSGDLYAMYQFMRFLSFVIGRDKALQNVAIGTKLIELQEVSRRAQERLTNIEVGEDSQSQADFQAELQKIRGEENMVATSQKLLTQMMEEYTGIKTSLDDVTKSMLDSWASSLKNASSWRI